MRKLFEAIRAGDRQGKRRWSQPTPACHFRGGDGAYQSMALTKGQQAMVEWLEARGASLSN